MREELFIIIDGKRHKLDLSRPSGITLEYVSNMFGDFDKIQASHSYTIKLPYTQTNHQVFELASDVRSDTSRTGAKFSTEYFHNGVPMFTQGNLYLQSASQEGYHCVLTWGELQGLQRIKEHNIPLNELGNYIANPDYTYSDVNADGEVINAESDKLCYLGKFTRYNDFLADRSQIVGSLHKPGVNPFLKAFIYPTDSNILYDKQISSEAPCFFAGKPEGSVNRAFNYEPGKLIKRGIVTTETANEEFTAKTMGKTDSWYVYTRSNRQYHTSAALPPPVATMPYLVKTISDYYGISIRIDDELYERLCVPFITVECSKRVYDPHYVEFKLESAGDDTKALYIQNFKYPSGSDDAARKDYNNYAQSAFIRLRTDGSSYNKQPNILCYRMVTDPTSTKTETYDNYLRFRLLIDGHMEFAKSGISEGDEETNKLYIDVQTLKRNSKEAGDSWATIATLESSFVGRYGFGSGTNTSSFDCIYRFDFREATGNENVESDIFYRWWGYDTADIRFELRWNENVPKARYKEGTFKVRLIHDKISDERYINVFQNLPDITCMDLLKSLGHVIGAYPALSADNGITYIPFTNLRKCIDDNKALDWSSRLLSEDSSEAQLDFSMGDVSTDYAQTNYYLMRNEEVDDNTGETQPNTYGEDAYATRYANIKIQDTTLKTTASVVQLPFFGAFIRNGKAPNIETYDNQSLFTTENGRQYTLDEAEPLLAEIIPVESFNVVFGPNSTPREIDDNTTLGTTYCGIKTWQFPAELGKDPRYSIINSILSSPRLLTISIALSELDLLNLDYSVPVYIDRYNSYFAVIKVVYDTNTGVSKATLIKIPNYDTV